MADGNPSFPVDLTAYEAGASAVRAAIAGLGHDALDAHPVPGTWSIHQIVTHLADCEQVFAVRMKWIIAEENPSIPGFSENLWMERLCATTRPADESALLLELTRRQVARILREIEPSAFNRFGTHSEQGRITLGDIVQKANWHLEHHLGFLRDKRRMLDK